jgi:hypothetical protein
MLAWRHAGMIPDLTTIGTSISAPCAARAGLETARHSLTALGGATLDSRPRGALMLKLTPLSPLLKVVRCAVRTRCVVPQWCKERDESPRIPQRRAEGRAGAQSLDFGRFEPSGRHARSRENVRCVIREAETETDTQAHHSVHVRIMQRKRTCPSWCA